MANRDREESDTWRPSADAGGSTHDPSGGVEHGYGQGGKTAFGQMVDGGSDMPGRGFGGSNAGGFGQQTQNSQWGQGGMGPMTQGANYSQGGGQFGPTGYQPLAESSGQGGQGQHPSHAPERQAYNAPNQGRQRDGTGQSSAGQYGQGLSPAPHHDDHEPHYRTWRENQIASHDRDYTRWREEQIRKYDEDYKGWRNERHSTFSKEFEGWRSGRGGQAGGSAPTEPAQGRSANAGTFATDAASETSAYGVGGAPGATGAASAATASSTKSGLGYGDHSDDDRQAVDPNAAHGANPTLAAVADGGTGSRHDRPADEHRKEEHKA